MINLYRERILPSFLRLLQNWKKGPALFSEINFAPLSWQVRGTSASGRKQVTQWRNSGTSVNTDATLTQVGMEGGMKLRENQEEIVGMLMHEFA